MAIYIICLILYSVLFFLARNVVLKQEEIPVYRKPFLKMSNYILQKTNIRKGRKHSIKQEDRTIAKLEAALMVGLGGLILFPFLDMATTTQEYAIVNQSIDRPEKGEGGKELKLQAIIGENEETKDVQLLVSEREYTDEEVEAFFEAAEEEAEKIVLGDNPSPNDVRGKVVLPGSLQNGEVSVQWIQDPQDLLDEEGNIIEEMDDDGEILMLRAVMYCSGKEHTYEFGLHLFPMIRSEEEQFDVDFQKAVERAQKDSVQKKILKLPAEVNGKVISWISPQNKMTGICLFLIFLTPVLAYEWKAQEFKKEDEARQRQLLLDYPDVVFKLGMLLNAGLTIQNAFTKIAMEYRDHGGKKRAAYDEMLYACYEMKSGVSEARAYENFGRRCKETCYVRLGTILSGGLQKSAEGLTTLLLKEADTAMEDRRQLARKMGEEAGTKLLFPMILMLMVVMIILIVPAFLSFT